jgi:hypothetical protein
MSLFCVKSQELLRRLRRPTLRLTDSQGVDGVVNRLPDGRKREPRYGEWGFFAHHTNSGPDMAISGWTNFNIPAGAVNLAVGDTPPGALAPLTFRNGTNATANSFAADFGNFTPMCRSYIRPSVWAIDWITNKTLRVGQLRVNPGSTGLLGANFNVHNTANTLVYSSPAIDESVGVAGNYSYFESPDIAMGSTIGDASCYRQSSNVDETGKTFYWLLHTWRRPDAATRYGEMSIGWGGATFDQHDNEAGQAASNFKYNDAYLDQCLTILPIEGDYDNGGVSGKVVIMLGQNGYNQGNQAQLLTWVRNLTDRIRASLNRVGKGNKDVLIEFVLQWDTTGDRTNYSVSEQVRFNEMDQVFREFAESRFAPHDKVAYTPMGLEVRNRFGSLLNWTSVNGSTGYLAGSGDFIHPNSIGARYFPTVEVDLYERIRVDAGPSIRVAKSSATVSLNTGRHAGGLIIG